jgi:purine-binding chemotaxis protein CheW
MTAELATAVSTAEPDDRAVRAHPGQYVSFTLGGEQYGVDVNRVQEIKGFDSVTRVPYAPAFVLGVINLRGVIVPLIDLRMRFGLEHAPYDSTTVIVVVRVAAARGERIAGLVVDAVNEVHHIAADRIRLPPILSGMIERAHVRGIADIEGRLLMLLDVESLVTSSIAA